MLFGFLRQLRRVKAGQVWYDIRPDHLRELQERSRHCDWVIYKVDGDIVLVKSLTEEEVYECWTKPWLLKNCDRRS